MQLQSRRSGPALHPFQRLAGFRLAPAQNHEVVGVPHHRQSRPRHEVVERVEIDIGQQRTDDRSLRSSLLRRPSFRRLHHLRGEIRFQQSEHPAIRHFLPHPVEKRRMRNRVEIAFQSRHRPPSCILPSTGRRPGAARPCSPASVGTRSCAPRSPARKSAPALPGAPFAPPGRAPSESPAGVFPCCPAW